LFESDQLTMQSPQPEKSCFEKRQGADADALRRRLAAAYGMNPNA